MTYVEFCYWLQGLFELASPAELTAQQVETIRNHLAMTEIVTAPPVPAPVRTINPDIRFKC